MMWELLILGVIVVLSVVAHYLMWRDSKKRHTEFMREFQELSERMRELESNYEEMDNELDAADEDVERIGKIIDAMHSALLMSDRKTGFDN